MARFFCGWFHSDFRIHAGFCQRDYDEIDENLHTLLHTNVCYRTARAGAVCKRYGLYDHGPSRCRNAALGQRICKFKWCNFQCAAVEIMNAIVWALIRWEYVTNRSCNSGEWHNYFLKTMLSRAQHWGKCAFIHLSEWKLTRTRINCVETCLRIMYNSCGKWPTCLERTTR